MEEHRPCSLQEKMLLHWYRQSWDLQPGDAIAAPSSPVGKGLLGGTWGESRHPDIPPLGLRSFSTGVYGGFRLSLDDDFVPATSNFFLSLFLFLFLFLFLSPFLFPFLFLSLFFLSYSSFLLFLFHFFCLFIFLLLLLIFSLFSHLSSIFFCLPFSS